MFMKYAVGQQLTVFIRALQELAVRTLIAPEQLAVWNLVTIVANTFTLFQSNVVAASNRLLSQMHGAKASERQLVAARGNSIYLELLQQSVLAFVLLIIAPWIWTAPEQLGNLFYLCAAAVMICNALLALFVGLHESSRSFGQLGIMLPLNAGVQALLIYMSALWFGLPGLIGGAIVGLALNISMLLVSLKLVGLRWLSRPAPQTATQLAHTAVSFRLADVPTTALYLLDAIIASLWLKPAALAIYMTARILVSFSSQAIFAANRLNLISLGNHIGQEKGDRHLAGFLTSGFGFVYLVLLPVTIAVFEPAFRWAIPVFLPKYADTIMAIPFLMLTSLTASRALFIRNYWIQKQQWRNILISGLVGLSGALAVFFIGKAWLGTVDARSMALMAFLGQLSYVIFVIVAVSYPQGKTDFTYRALAFVASFVGVMLVLKLNGALDEREIGSFFEAIVTIIKGVLICVPFALAGGWMFKRRPVVSEETKS